MSFRFKVKEPLAEGMQRIALEQIEIAQGELRSNADAEAAVHNARRALKRLRALLRLVRPALSEAEYRRQSQRFAGIGRQLSGERDRHVMRQTLKKLTAETQGVSEEFTAAFEAALAQAPAASGRSGGDARASAARALVSARKSLGGVLEQLDAQQVFEGMKAVYRRGRRLHRRCHAPADGQVATGEDFHALRKAVQQHWRHMQLLSRSWPDALGARAAEAKALSQILGEDHDLHVLSTFLSAHADALPQEARAALLAAAARAQTALRERARLHADRLFAERARDLTDRLRAYWATAQGMAALESASSAAEAADEADRPHVTPKPRVRRAARGPSRSAAALKKRRKAVP